jgi:membrane protein required for colicin V production
LRRLWRRASEARPSEPCSAQAFADPRRLKDNATMVGPLTYLDAALLAVMLLSGLLAMYRGFTREVLSILSWIVAAGAVVYFVFNHRAAAEQLAQQFSAPPIVALIVAGAVIFLVVLIIVHLITARISDTVLDSSIGMIDRVLGFVFGAIRGFILIVIPYMFYESFSDPQNQYKWVQESKSLPYIKSTGATFRDVLVRFVPSSPDKDSKPEQQG